MTSAYRRPRAFLSYSKYDLDWVRVFRQELTQLAGAEVDIFWDQDLEQNDEWNSFLEREVDEAHHMILVATPESLASPDVQKERNLFVQRTKTERLYTVQRGRLRLPQAWTTKQMLMCCDDASFRSALAKLAAELRGVPTDLVPVGDNVTNPHWDRPSRLPDTLYQRLVDLLVQALGRCGHSELASLSYALDLTKGWDAPFSHVELKANAAIQTFVGERDPVATSLLVLDKLDDTVIPRHAADRYGQLQALRRDIDAARHPPPSPSAPRPKARKRRKPPASRSTHHNDLTRYRTAILSACGTIEFAGFESKVQAPIETEKLFVPLRAVIHDRREKLEYASGEEAAKSRLAADASQLLTLEAGLAKARASKQRGVVVLGDPGSGKTTLLRRTAWAAIHDPTEIGLTPDTLPVLLPLRKCQPGDFDHGLDVFLQHELPKHAALPSDFGKRLVATGRLLVLVDGFDEVTPAERTKVVQWLGSMVRQRADWTFVVTSRYAGYQGEARFDEFLLELNLLPLTDDGITAFVHKWYDAVESTLKPDSGPTTAVELAGDLLEKLIGKGQTSRRLLEMAGNPMLLTNICLVHRSRGRHLPRDRHELYRECIDLLLERWPDLAKRQRVTRQAGTLAMQAVAMHMHTKGLAIAPQAELLPALESGMSLAGIGGKAADFLRHVQHDCGLLTGWSGDRFGFLHLGFQEYLAALEISRLAAKRAHAGDATRAEVATLARHFGDDWWREVILLLLATDGNLCEPFFAEVLQHKSFANDSGLRTECLQAALQKSPEPFVSFLRRKAGPGSTVARIGSSSHAAWEALHSWLPSAADELRKELPHLASALDQAVQAAERDRRVREMSGIQLIQIPAGDFQLGSVAPEGPEQEWPRHLVIIAKPFWLARTPVSNAQYRAFVEATNHERPEAWKDRRFNAEDQPVVGVSWQDAQAFCKWAGLRLPSETEWEYACRAGTTTPFSFGPNITPEQVNYNGNYPYRGMQKGLYRARTVPVGSLPANPWGLHEVHGNVWEWCQDLWHDNYEGAPTDGSAWEQGGSGARVVRGGCWLDNARACRSASRSGWPRRAHYDYLGFRPAGSSL